MRPAIVAVVLLVLPCGCDRDAPAPAGTVPAASAPVVAPSAPAGAVAAGDRAPAFVGPVWRVEPGSGVEAGTTYTFLPDGTLAIDAPHGTPARGEWRYDDGKLTLVEEGIAYATDIVALDAAHFVIRSHNPGGTVEIAMVRGAPATSR